MSTHPENDLQRLLAEEPFVRSLAQHLVAEDADEVVQQTFLRAIQQGGEGVERPRSWLRRIVRNVAANVRRGDRRRRDHQRAAAVQALVPSTAELAEREESRRALVAAVNRLSPTLRTVVVLRWFEGLQPRRIAAMLNIPAATVSTQLRRAQERLRQLLDAQYGGQRRAWLLPLVPFVVRPPLPAPPLLPALPALFSGVIAMTIKSKLVIAITVLLAVGVWLYWSGDAQPPTSPPATTVGASVEPARVEFDQQPLAETTPTIVVEREAVTTTTAVASTGSLHVMVRYGDDHAPAAGLMMTLRRLGSDGRYEGLRRLTDDAGAVHYDEAPPGRMYVSGPNGRGKRVEIVAGQLTEADLELEVGLTLTGIVVDASHKPVAGALVETTMMAHAGRFPEVMAVTGVDGRFAVRASPKWCLVGARAAGYIASNVQFLLGKDGNTAEVELVLGQRGGMVDGIVVDPEGKPVAGAVVIIGDGELSGISGRDHIPPFAALARTDDDGKFHAVGVAAGKQKVQARAPGFAPWQGECEITAGLAVPQRIELEAGAVIEGVVYDAAGQTVDRADVQVGTWKELAFFRTKTSSDGSFELSGLPVGELQLSARHNDFGKTEHLVSTENGVTATAQLHLSRGLQLSGRVVDPEGNPVANAYCNCVAEQATTKRWSTFSRADVQGRFVADNCPENGTISIRVSAKGFEELHQPGIDPKAGEVQLQLQRRAARTVRIVATVVGPDGHPVKNATVSARREGVRGSSTGLIATDNAGRFELGPLTPGKWTVYVRTKKHPDYSSDARELAANAVCDLGTITLPRGGTALVRQPGVANSTARFRATDPAQKRWWGFTEDGGEIRSSVLVPGDYLLVVDGADVAAQIVPFTIQPGVETTVDVQMHQGTAQTFKIEPPSGDNVVAGSLKIMQGKRLVGRAWARDRGDGIATAETWLAPGDYTVTATIGALVGSSSFTVGAVSDQPVRITLR